MVEYKVEYKKYSDVKRWNSSPVKGGLRELRAWFKEYKRKRKTPYDWRVKKRRDFLSEWKIVEVDL